MNCSVKNCTMTATKQWSNGLGFCQEHHEGMINQPKQNTREEILEKRKADKAISSTVGRGLPHGYTRCG